MSNIETFQAIGRRKTSVARIYMTPGNGEIMVNKTEADHYFDRPSALMIIDQPLELTGTKGKVNIRVNVRGGGKSGQADAIKHGISRALLLYDPQLRPTLKSAGFLTRDARIKERKKYGQRGARARFQFSKR